MILLLSKSGADCNREQELPGRGRQGNILWEGSGETQDVHVPFRVLRSQTQ